MGMFGSSKPLIKLRGQAEAVSIGHRNFRSKFVLSNWTADQTERPLPESIPTVITSWRTPPPFEGRLVEIIGHMGRYWNKHYLVAQSLHIPQMAYEVRRINWRILLAILALVVLLPLVFFESVSLYNQYHNSLVAQKSNLDLQKELLTIKGKDIYLCGGAVVDGSRDTNFPRMIPLKVVSVTDTGRPELHIQMPDRVSKLSLESDNNNPPPDLDSVLASSYAYTAIPQVFTEDELKHIRSRTIAIDMSRRAVDCATTEPFFEEPGSNIVEQDVKSPTPMKVFYTGGKVTSIVPAAK